MKISLSDIVTADDNIRMGDVDQSLEELIASMDADGQEIPIHVMSTGTGTYIVKHGHRRLAAAKALNWETIDAVLDATPDTEEELIIARYNENEIRKKLGYLEKAQVFARLKDLGWTQRQIAQKFGASDADVSLALATLRAHPDLQKAIESGDLSPSAAEPLLSQSMETQEKLVAAALQAKTVRKVSALVKAHNTKKEITNMEVEFDDNDDDDIDPLEELALHEIEQSLEHLKQADAAKIQHPELVRQARPKVEELLQMAASLRKSFTGETWDNLKDLL